MKILAIQNRMGIGDMVIFLPFIEAISKKFDTPVNLLVKENTKAKEYLKNNKYIDQIINLDQGNIQKYLSFFLPITLFRTKHFYMRLPNRLL